MPEHTHPGPTDAELRMLRVYDTFEQLLERTPAKANQMSKAIEDIAQQFAPPAGRAAARDAARPVE
jgi:hypothetical protein